jgi:hypothetical protein
MRDTPGRASGAVRRSFGTGRRQPDQAERHDPRAGRGGSERNVAWADAGDPVLDDAGNLLADYPLEVVAKTGTLNFVSTLAGYVQAPDPGAARVLGVLRRSRPPGRV